MFTSRSTFPAIIFFLVLALSIATLAQTRTPSTPAAGDQARYAEIATTSDQASIPLASTTASISVPIVVYHIVRPSYPDDSPAVKALAVTPEIFDAQMTYLEQAAYHVVPLSVLEDYFILGKPLPIKPIIISFDDGWRDQFLYAFPILVAHHYPATFFVFTNAIGKRGFFSWDDLKALIQAGMVIGSHSRSHPYLTAVGTSTALWNEIKGSRDILEEHLGLPVREFAYPFGRYSPAIKALVKEAGYRSARGDFESGEQASARLYELSALNAPTTLSLFKRMFPPEGYVPYQWYRTNSGRK